MGEQEQATDSDELYDQMADEDEAADSYEPEQAGDSDELYDQLAEGAEAGDSEELYVELAEAEQTPDSEGRRPAGGTGAGG